MTNWLIFAGIFMLFLASHSIPVRAPVKRRLVETLGALGFSLAYSALSLVMLGLLIWGARQAPFVPLWSEAPWHRPLVWLGMLGVCQIAALSVGRPNPFSFGGRHNDKFDPNDPGVVGYLRHPLLGALALWAAMHMLANGDVAHVILFGALCLFALVGPFIVDRRKKREFGSEKWANLLSEARKHRKVQRPTGKAMLRVGLGVLIYLLLVVLHPYIIGVPVIV